MPQPWSRLLDRFTRIDGAWAPAPEDDRGLAAHRRALADLRLDSVAVVVGPDDLEKLIGTWGELFAGASVTAFVLSEEPAEESTADTNQELPWQVRPVGSGPEVHRLMASWGPYDVIVEHGSTAQDEKRRLLRWLLGHVRPGGVYVIEDLAAVWSGHQTAVPGGNVIELACRLAQASGGAALPAEGLEPLDRELAATVDSVELSRELLVVRRTGEVSIKVRHTELQAMLRRRDAVSWSRVIRRVRPTTVESDAMGYHNDEEQRAKRYPATFGVPKLLLREYDDVVALPRGILVRDNLVLPDSFRLWGSGTQTHSQLRDTSHFFVHAPQVPTPERLTGQYYYLDHEYPVHFGHFMTERLGRLWGWPEAKAANPELKLLVSKLAPFQVELLAAFGVAPEDIVTFEGAVQVESLIAAMPMYHIGRYVSPGINDVYRRLQSGVEQVSGDGHERIFLTRERGLWRECVNGPELEALFAARGFTVLRPEEHTIAEQAALFREARVVAGYIGSQLYGQLFSREHLDVIGFVGPSYNSNNEYLLATALGHTLHQFWCPEEPATREKDITGRPIIRMHQDFRFDFERDQPALEDLLDRL